VSRLREECRRPDDASALAVEGLVLELLAEISRARAEPSCTHPPRWLDRVLELLRDRFSENVSLDEVAATAGVSADHLTRTFRRYHGCTIGEYIRRLRIEYACQRLLSSQDCLIKLALDAGFYDQSHFTKAFKRHMGVTPATFRNQRSLRISRTKD
jgi:AraC-like DNA-binding protein